jgi:transcription antitermination factor NusB
MLNKRKARELAMQSMFLWDSNGSRDADLARQLIEDGTEDLPMRETATLMAAGAWEQREAIDERVERVAPQWPPRRQPGVDRNLIRLAVWEMTNSDTPPKVVIDEAIEMAKKFSTEQSPAFVNGVLDAVLKEHQALIDSPGAKREGPTEPNGST